jgi:hypothetical protein
MTTLEIITAIATLLVSFLAVGWVVCRIGRHFD